MSTTIEIAYNYLDEIEAYFAATLSAGRLESMLCAMANEAGDDYVRVAFKLTGPLRAEFDAMLADGRIQSVMQNAWDELNECVLESAYEQSYFRREDAEMIRRMQEPASV